MARFEGAFHSELWRPVLDLSAACGLALLLSIPAATAVGDLTSASGLARTIGLDLSFLFFDVLVFATALFGRWVGTAVAASAGPTRRALSHAALGVALGEVACLPYLAYSVAVFSGDFASVGLVLCISGLVSLAMAWLALAAAGIRGATGAVWLFLFAWIAVPLVGAPLISPVGAARRMLAGAAAWESLLAVGTPMLAVASAAVLLWLRRGVRHAT
ncbi:MAG: hypothetical protein AB1778_08660 [Candidatus Bipolaricaulota bacterium]